MKIIIYNEELRSEMQMYLALSNHFDVTIAEDEDDLMQLLDKDHADFTFIDLGDCERGKAEKRSLAIASRIQKRHPKIKLVGICDFKDENIAQIAAGYGIRKVVTRPIKNRELLEAIA